MLRPLASCTCADGLISYKTLPVPCYDDALLSCLVVLVPIQSRGLIDCTWKRVVVMRLWTQVRNSTEHSDWWRACSSEDPSRSKTRGGVGGKCPISALPNWLHFNLMLDTLVLAVEQQCSCHACRDSSSGGSGAPPVDP